tara:strand:+ start:714 stop:914 length:201 start_codon:yes stop_codon:yes gene_type:complete
MIVLNILLSISSSPFISTLSALRLDFVILISILPSPFICAKSLTLLRREFAILGVPLLLLAISIAA